MSNSDFPPDSYNDANGDEIYVERQETCEGNLGTDLLLLFFGLVFLFFAIALEAGNEARAVRDAHALDRANAETKIVNPIVLDASDEGKTICVTGFVDSDAPINENDFGLKLKALRLKRDVQMYQWIEDKTQNTEQRIDGRSNSVTNYRYSRGWDSSEHDSRDFKKSASHQNPSFFYRSESLLCPSAHLGKYRISTKIVEKIGSPQTYKLPTSLNLEAISINVGKKTMAFDNVIYLGQNPKSPAIGDQKISFRYVPNHEIFTLVGVQRKGMLMPLDAATGGHFDLVKKGPVSVSEIFTEARKENSTQTWFTRIAAAFLSFVGFLFMNAPVARWLQMIPFLGGLIEVSSFVLALGMCLVTNLSVFAVCWLTARPELAHGAAIAVIITLVLTLALGKRN